MSEFREVVEEILREYDIKYNIRVPSYKELCNIFNILPIEELTEDSDDNTAYLTITYNYYKELLKRLNNQEYTQTLSGAYKINFDDLDVYILYGNLGTYKYSNYDPEDKIISVYTTDINNIKNDIIFRSNFMHELTHYLSEHEDDSVMPWNYISPDEDEIKYYTQPSELLSNKVAMCDFMIGLIEKRIRHKITKKDLENIQHIQNTIDDTINVITSNPGFIYHKFLVALSKDKQAFKDFYKEIVDTCIKYIKSNLEECITYSIYNSLVNIK